MVVIAIYMRRVRRFNILGVTIPFPKNPVKGEKKWRLASGPTNQMLKLHLKMRNPTFGLGFLCCSGRGSFQLAVGNMRKPCQISNSIVSCIKIQFLERRMR